MSKYRVQTSIAEVEPKFDVSNRNSSIANQRNNKSEIRKKKRFPLLINKSKMSIISGFKAILFTLSIF